MKLHEFGGSELFKEMRQNAPTIDQSSNQEYLDDVFVYRLSRKTEWAGYITDIKKRIDAALSPEPKNPEAAPTPKLQPRVSITAKPKFEQKEAEEEIPRWTNRNGSPLFIEARSHLYQENKKNIESLYMEIRMSKADRMIKTTAEHLFTNTHLYCSDINRLVDMLRDAKLVELAQKVRALQLEMGSKLMGTGRSKETPLAEKIPALKDTESILPASAQIEDNEEIGRMRMHPIVIIMDGIRGEDTHKQITTASLAHAIERERLKVPPSLTILVKILNRSDGLPIWKNGEILRFFLDRGLWSSSYTVPSVEKDERPSGFEFFEEAAAQ